ncbi:uncharacterized protein [Blastocystis hominis]|uniref:Uncharacterized protein n=1 Tax=Blastocystis hominis TaxID=12968 RepID=D8M2W2_BLAHO|nr:uncharacterized protein [Blastocystis hominis]CBK22685.2 unnamed protein product [Blastocystis hominis]|eukprot:XP_012896733.1 uncharacterized protein [Blastocystis hominis]
MAFLEELERSKDTPQTIQCIDFSFAGIGNDGFTRFVDLFIDNPHLKLRELRLQGNNLGPNQITYLTNQLHFGSLSASKAFIFPDLRVLDLSNNPLGNEGVSQLFLLFKHNCFPDLRQVFLLNCRFGTDIASTLLSIHLHENNLINFVTGATQASLMPRGEQSIIERLEERIEAGSLRNLEIRETVSDACLQLYFSLAVANCVNTVEKIVLKNVDLSGGAFHLVSAILRRYVAYGRCGRLASLSLIECNLDDSHVPSLLRLLRTLAAHRSDFPGFPGFSFLNLEGFPGFSD